MATETSTTPSQPRDLAGDPMYMVTARLADAVEHLVDVTMNPGAGPRRGVFHLPDCPFCGGNTAGPSMVRTA